MRILHRIGGLFAGLVMLYLAVTGVTIQTLDLKTLLSHTPPTDPMMMSINEGRWGNDDFPVISLSDYSAVDLPDGFNYRQAFATVLDAMHSEDPGLAPAYIELRMAGGVPIGEVLAGDRVQAFDAATGKPVAPVRLVPVGSGNSLREKIKRFHRFWPLFGRPGDTPGVYFELISGLLLWTLLITGLVLYFRMLSGRAKAGKRQIFWGSGGGWRALHRVVSVAAALFLILIAFSGTWLGFESVVKSLRSPHSGVPLPSSAYAATLQDAEVQQMAAATLAAMTRFHPQTPIKVIRLRVYGRMRQGVIVTGGGRFDQYVFNTDTGEPATLGDTRYPDSGFPFGTQVHENIKHFHSGEMFGIAGRTMNLLAGLALAFLSVSGGVVYWEMWRKRRSAGRGAAVLWT